MIKRLIDEAVVDCWVRKQQWLAATRNFEHAKAKKRMLLL